MYKLNTQNSWATKGNYTRDKSPVPSCLSNSYDLSKEERKEESQKPKTTELPYHQSPTQLHFPLFAWCFCSIKTGFFVEFAFTLGPFSGICRSPSLCWGFDHHYQLVEEKRRKIMASDTKRGPVSRLSPLAKPFILNTPKNSSSALNPSLQDTSLSPSSSRFAQSFSSFRVEGDSFSCYSLYPSRVYQSSDDFGLFTESKSDLDALPESKSAELGYKAHKSGDHQEILHWKDNHGGLSMSNDDSTKQGVL